MKVKDKKLYYIVRTKRMSANVSQMDIVSVRLKKKDIIYDMEFLKHDTQASNRATFKVQDVVIKLER